MKQIKQMKLLGRILITIACSLLPLSAACAADEIAMVVNGGFEDGLKGWRITGDVCLDTNAALNGNASARIGAGAGSLMQRIETGSGNHFTMSTTIQTQLTNGWFLAIRFLDKDGREVMKVDTFTDLHPDKQDPRQFSHYMKVHPLTKWIEIVISKDKTWGFVSVDDVGIKMPDENAAALKTTWDLDQAMLPFWQGKTIYNEAVLMLSKDGKPAIGQLMFRPSRIISVQDYGLATNYLEGTDYTAYGRTLTRTASSRMTQIRDEDLLKGELKWNQLGGRQVMVTYEHDDAWNYQLPAYIGDQLPGTMKKLQAHAPLKIVAYGDSITHGVGASRLSHIRPFLPPWAELFVHQLQTIYHDRDIQLFNSAQSGADAYWASTMASRMVASMHPDLVVIAFGQNDFWSYPADYFSKNISSVINTVRAANPAAEFLLVSTMRFDPDYTANTNYWNVVGEYSASLRSIAGQGVQLVDMTAISELVYGAKKPKDCVNDPLHPNDYLARWYAQSLVAALDPASGHPLVFRGGTSIKKGVGHYGHDMPEIVDSLGCSWYYNWTATPFRADGSIHAQFVPMIWYGADIDATLAAAKETGSTNLLGFNEPDNEGESDMPVAEAVSLWPKLMATGMRLGSPATTTGSHWLEDFMAEAKQKKLRVDFLCLHWYGDITKPNAIEALRKYLQGYWDRYHLPIWLTEFSGGNFEGHSRKATIEDNAAFAAGAGAMIERLPFVERYAWYGDQWSPQDGEYPTVGLYDAKIRALTPVGIAYRDVAKH
jgi:lysophospholipase L1-like esterase